MSIAEEEPTVPWIGPCSYKNCLSIVVMSTNDEIIENVAQALTAVHKNGSYRWKLIIHRAFMLEDVLKQRNVTGQIAIDFIVIAMDTSALLCLDWAQNIVKQMDPDLKRRRAVLVNASGLPANEFKVDSASILNFQNETKLDLMSANVYIPDEAVFLAQRLLRYIVMSIGMKTGVPNLNL